MRVWPSGTSYSAAGVRGPTLIAMQFLPLVAGVEVLVNGESRRFAPSPAPSATGLALKFAYVSVDEPSFTVIAYDAAGAELAREERAANAASP